MPAHACHAGDELQAGLDAEEKELRPGKNKHSTD